MTLRAVVRQNATTREPHSPADAARLALTAVAADPGARAQIAAGLDVRVALSTRRRDGVPLIAVTMNAPGQPRGARRLSEGTKDALRAIAQGTGLAGIDPEGLPDRILILSDPHRSATLAAAQAARLSRDEAELRAFLKAFAAAPVGARGRAS